MRAATAAGREVFGYNRSVDGVKAAQFDGFDATDSLDEALSRATQTESLIVLAVPMPALGAMLERIRAIAPDCPLTDVISVKGPVLAQVEAAGLRPNFVGGHPMTGTAHSGWAAGEQDLFAGTPWVVSVDDGVDAAVWASVMRLALDCRAFVVPARSDEHDGAAAAISHLPHLLAETLAVTAGDVPLAFALAAGSFRDGTRVAATAPDLVRAMCEANSEQGPAGRSSRPSAPAVAHRPGPRQRVARRGARPAGRAQLGGRSGGGGPRGQDALRQLQQARHPRRHHRRPGLAGRTRRCRPGRRGDQIRVASPG